MLGDSVQIYLRYLKKILNYCDKIVKWKPEIVATLFHL